VLHTLAEVARGVNRYDLDAALVLGTEDTFAPPPLVGQQCAHLKPIFRFQSEVAELPGRAEKGPYSALE
jgi:hypothetical protein